MVEGMAISTQSQPNLTNDWPAAPLGSGQLATPLRVFFFEEPYKGVVRCLSCHNRMGLDGTSPAVPWCEHCRRSQPVGPLAVIEEVGEGVTRCISCHNRVGLDCAFLVGPTVICGHCRALLF